MGIESLRRSWTRRATRWGHRTAGAAAPAAGSPDGRTRRGFGSDEAQAQAQALCDLVADSAADIRRVTVVGASPRLLEAIEDVAEERGVDLDEGRVTSVRLLATGEDEVAR